MTFLVILFAVLFFSLIIFIHELGHFVAARIFGVTVHEFSIGMGPAVWKKEGKSKTTYSVRCIPIGGFCKMEGEDDDSTAEGSFSGKSKFARFVILAAGAGMNLILGLLISLILTFVTSGGGIATTTVEKTVPNSPVSEYIKPNDVITKINGHHIHIRQEIALALALGGNSADITVKRNGEKIEYKDIPLTAYTEDGVSQKMLGVVCKVAPGGFFSVLHEGFFQTVYMVKTVFLSLSMLFSGEAKLSDISGPIGVIDQMQNTVTASGGGLYGFLNLLYLSAFISVNIGIMNLLPLPALDGGRILFILIELIFRRRVPPEKEGIVHFIGIILLFGLMIFAARNDILRLLG